MDFTQPWDSGDVTFTIEDKKIYASKAVLKMCSEVFKAMFTLDFAEKEMEEIPLPDKKFDDFLRLMQILHPHTLQRLDYSSAHHILPLADEYQINHVYEECVRTLSDGRPSILILNIAETYKLTELHDKCLQYLKDTPLSKLEAEAGFTKLNSDTLITALSYKSHKFESLCKEVFSLKNGYTLYTDHEKLDKICEILKNYK